MKSYHQIWLQATKENPEKPEWIQNTWTSWI